MATINLTSTVPTGDDQALSQVQQRFEQPIQQLISTPWGNGTLVSNLTCGMASGSQTITVKHGLGRKATGSVIWAANVPAVGPYNLTYIDQNTCKVTVTLTAAANVAPQFSIWVG